MMGGIMGGGMMMGGSMEEMAVIHRLLSDYYIASSFFGPQNGCSCRIATAATRLPGSSPWGSIGNAASVRQARPHRRRRSG